MSFHLLINNIVFVYLVLVAVVIQSMCSCTLLVNFVHPLSHSLLAYLFIHPTVPSINSFIHSLSHVYLEDILA